MAKFSNKIITYDDFDKKIDKINDTFDTLMKIKEKRLKIMKNDIEIPGLKAMILS